MAEGQSSEKPDFSVPRPLKRQVCFVHVISNIWFSPVTYNKNELCHWIHSTCIIDLNMNELVQKDENKWIDWHINW